MSDEPIPDDESIPLSDAIALLAQIEHLIEHAGFTIDLDVQITLFEPDTDRVRGMLRIDSPDVVRTIQLGTTGVPADIQRMFRQLDPRDLV